MRDLRVTMVQCMLHWEDAEANRQMFADELRSLAGATDLIVLPEMFNTGFSMRSDVLAETMDGATIDQLKLLSRQLDAAIYGSMIVEENGHFHNRGLFVRPDGLVTSYDKRHLFRMAQEQMHFSAGKERVVVHYKHWRILLQVCYDLRFPVFSRNRNDHDLALYVANWPAVRRDAWMRLLPARAIENQCYVIGVNRVGMDGKGIHYAGDSVALDHRGSVIGSCGENISRTLTVELSLERLNEAREKFPVMLDADEFELDLDRDDRP